MSRKGLRPSLFLHRPRFDFIQVFPYGRLSRGAREFDRLFGGRDRGGEVVHLRLEVGQGGPMVIRPGADFERPPSRGYIPIGVLIPRPGI